jgi:tetratricopeptide (TPR) repeat protein
MILCEREPSAARRRLILILCLFLPAALFAQMDMSSHVMGTQFQVDPAQLPPPVRMTGIGNAHLAISSKKAETQAWFDQGLNLLHDYWDYESARAFEQSIRVDPDCAICYWGLYQALSFYHGNETGYAPAALARAKELKNHANDRERRYIEATAPPDGDRRKAADLWRGIVKDYPDDLEARILLSTSGGNRLEILESILKDDPNNSAANHQYIHALEGSDHPERALHSAEILGSLAPNAGHMVHMPGHIFFRLGDYAKAEKSFADSTAVDEKYMAAQHVEPDNDWNYVHNLMYAIANLMEEGKLKQAHELSAKITRAHGKLPSSIYAAVSRDSISRLNPQLPVALRLGAWAEVKSLLAATPPPAALPDLVFLSGELNLFADGMLAVEKRDAGTADAAWRKLDASIAAEKQAPHPNPNVPFRHVQVMPDAYLSPLLGMLNVMSLELHASVLAAQNKVTDAHDMFAQAEAAEKALGYREPPNYIRPVAETEGTAMLAIGDWTDARAAWERDLTIRPRSGFALYGIALSDERAGKSEAAAKDYREFLNAWKDADPDLPQLVHARDMQSRQ